MLLDGEVGALPKVLEAYMCEATLLTNPTGGGMAWAPWVLGHGGKVAKYASGCYNVAPTTR